MAKSLADQWFQKYGKCKCFYNTCPCCKRKLKRKGIMSTPLIAGFILIGIFIFCLGVMMGYDLRTSQINDIIRREKEKLIKERAKLDEELRLSDEAYEDEMEKVYASIPHKPAVNDGSLFNIERQLHKDREEMRQVDELHDEEMERVLLNHHPDNCGCVIHRRFNKVV